MSLLHMSGFEGAPKTREVISASASYIAGGRTGMCLLMPGGNNNCTIALPAPKGEIVVGVAVKPLSGYDPGQPIRISLGDSGDRIALWLTASGGLQVVRYNQYNSASGIATAAAAWTMDQYLYVEMHVKLDPTNGFCRVRANGVEVINFTGPTQDNGSSTASSFAYVSLWGPSVNWAGNCHYDDLYILDVVDGTALQGRAFNAPLGQPKIEPLALSASGPTNEWVGSDGDSVDNHLLVDEVPPSATDYIESSTVGQRDLYDFATPTLSGEILAVDVSAFAASPDGGTNPIKMVARTSAGTAQVGAGAVPGGSYKYITDGPKGKDPDGNTWTKTAVGDATFGVEVG